MVFSGHTGAVQTGCGGSLDSAAAAASLAEGDGSAAGVEEDAAGADEDTLADADSDLGASASDARAATGHKERASRAVAVGRICMMKNV